MPSPLTQTWLLVIGFSIFLSCHAKLRVCFTGSEHKEYDDSVMICCNGEIRLRVRDQDCCNTTLYFTTLSICCGGKVKSRYVPPKGSWLSSCSSNDEQCREQTCCGGTPVDKEDTMCCQQQPVHLNYTQQLNRDFLQCCGENVIHSLSYFCCGGTKFPINSDLGCCDGKVFDIQVKKCLTTYRPHRVVSKDKNICGGQEYDMRTNSCCSGILHSMPELDPLNSAQRNPNFTCCDKIAYDSTKEKCCRESHTGFPTHTIVNEPNIYCCGNGSYNAKHQDCYKGEKLEKVPGKVQCGYGYIDGQTEKCCVNTKYNAESQKCCMGDKFSVILKNQRCCNGEGMNETTLCCEGITTCVKRKLDDDECCYNYRTKRANTYNSQANEHCVEGEVIQLPHGAEACGILDYYFPETQICCGEKVYNIAAGSDKCCDDKPYNSITQQCCNYEISNISPQEGSCCGKDFTVYRFDDNKNPCRSQCGNETYDDTYQICCQGVVHELNDYTECCGSSAINSLYDGCCGGLFSWSKIGNTRCCGERDLYNKKHAKCVKNKVLLRDLTLRKLSDVQNLCNRNALKYFDGGIKYACESKNIFKARLVNVQVLEKIRPNTTYISLSFADATGLERGEHLNSVKVPSNLIINIEVPHHDDIKCKRSYFTRYCKVIVFFNSRLKGENITISRNSKFFMTSHTRKRESLITKKLSYEFCKSNFNVH